MFSICVVFVCREVIDVNQDVAGKMGYRVFQVGGSHKKY